MPSATAQQYERRQAITRLLNERPIGRQTELVNLLRAEGFIATQSSVSRDLQELGAAKLKNRYSLPPQQQDGDDDSLQLVSPLIRDIRSAGPNMLIISTAVGGAQRVAVTLDRASWPEVVGTLSGDDTIFVATASSAQQQRLRSRLRQNFTKAKL